MFMNAKNSDKGVNNGDVATVGDNNGGGRYVGDVDSDDDDDDDDDSFYHVSPYLAKSVGPCPNKSCKRPFYNISSSYGHGAIRSKKPFVLLLLLLFSRRRLFLGVQTKYALLNHCLLFFFFFFFFSLRRQPSVFTSSFCSTRCTLLSVFKPKDFFFLTRAISRFTQ